MTKHSIKYFKVRMTHLEGETTPTTFTQEQVNAIIKKEKESWRKSNESTLEELKALREKANLSDEEKATMDARIKTLETDLLSKEDLAKREITRLENERKTAVAELTADRDSWKSLYTTSRIQQTILEAASNKDTEAFNPSQIVMLLENTCKLVPVLEDGKPTGKYQVQTTWVDDKGKEIPISVSEKLKRMKEQSDKFGNLFKADAKGGIGGSTGQQSGSSGITPSALSDAAEYRKQRDNIIQQVK